MLIWLGRADKRPDVWQASNAGREITDIRETAVSTRIAEVWSLSWEESPEGKGEESEKRIEREDWLEEIATRVSVMFSTMRRS